MELQVYHSPKKQSVFCKNAIYCERDNDFAKNTNICHHSTCIKVPGRRPPLATLNTTGYHPQGTIMPVNHAPASLYISGTMR